MELTPDAAFRAILEARERLVGGVHRTPVVTGRGLDERVGARVFLKCESFQRTGSFKLRGAMNALASLSQAERERGVVTHSSGNHAQALALAGRLLESPVTVVMPHDAPAIKRRATEGYGAEVVEYRRGEDRREELSAALSERRGLTLVPPFDHPLVIAGQGTAALELLGEVPDLDLLLAPCGGGGLLSGSAVAVRGTRPGCRVIGVEPEGADDAARSFASGVLHEAEHPRSIADGLLTPALGRHTFPLIRALVADLVTVPEEAIVESMLFLFHRLKLVVEPSGAVALAALLSGRVRGRGKVGVILSGGNVDAATFARLVAS